MLLSCRAHWTLPLPVHRERNDSPDPAQSLSSTKKSCRSCAGDASVPCAKGSPALIEAATLAGAVRFHLPAIGQSTVRPTHRYRSCRPSRPPATLQDHSAHESANSGSETSQRSNSTVLRSARSAIVSARRMDLALANEDNSRRGLQRGVRNTEHRHRHACSCHGEVFIRYRELCDVDAGTCIRVHGSRIVVDGDSIAKVPVPADDQPAAVARFAGKSHLAREASRQCVGPGDCHERGHIVARPIAPDRGAQLVAPRSALPR